MVVYIQVYFTGIFLLTEHNDFHDFVTEEYCNNPKYWDRKVFANSVDLYQMLQYAASDQGLHCLPTYSNILDTSRGSRIEYFKF